MLIYYPTDISEKYTPENTIVMYCGACMVESGQLKHQKYATNGRHWYMTMFHVYVMPY